MNDSTYPWFILVPRREGIREIHELSEEDQRQLIREISSFSSFIQESFGAEKMNVAALGNMVPQLHIHVIARYASDPAWPGPVWGKVPARPYADEDLARVLSSVREFQHGAE